MKLKIVIVDFEIPLSVKRWALGIGIPAVVLLGGAAVAYASGLVTLVTWQTGQQLNASDLNANFTAVQIPSGAVVAFAGPVVPAGWLVCNGSAVSRTMYANLFSAIGTASGGGDGSTTFNLPNYQGYFLRGLDTSEAVDPGRTLGSVEADAFATHTHSSMGGPFLSGDNATATSNAAPGWATAAGEAYWGPNVNGYSTTAATGGAAETRPKNVAVNYMIKY
jgi:microcystin-dependent protein